MQTSNKTKRSRDALEISSSSDDDDEEEESSSTVARKCSRRKVEKNNVKECIFVDDDSDEDIEIEFLGTSSSLVVNNGASASFWDSPTSYQMSRGATGNRSQDHGTTIDNRKLPPVNFRRNPRLANASRTEGIMETINSSDSADVLLRKLLQHIGCRYSLLSHQYEGVRKTAGVGSDYPKDVVGSIKQSSLHLSWNEVLSKSSLTKRRGIIMADAMGLGKTVQGVVACMLRNAIASGDPKPTILVGPNESVLNQWRESLVKAGVSPGRIRDFIKAEPDVTYSGNAFVLLTRYQLQSETRGLLSRSKGEHSSSPVPKSPLFPRLNNSILAKLRNIYACSNGKEECKYKLEKETLLECTTRLLTEAVPDIPHSFRTVIIDEAHFHKNLLAYWGIGAAMLGLCADWLVPMTGTPYNNRSQDMATLMAFINPSHPSSNDKWWRDATSAGDAASVARVVHNWSSCYIVRREKDVMTVQLPNKSVLSENLSVTQMEIAEYDSYEARFLKVMKAFSRLQHNDTPQANWEKKMMFRNMLSIAARMRMALIHPVLPDGGRDLSIHFSPSRQHLANNLSRPARCVCCGANTNHQRNKLQRHDDLVGDEFTNGDDLDDDDDEQQQQEDADFALPNDVPRGSTVKIPDHLCMVSHKGPTHFAHEACLEVMIRSGRQCPKCIQLKNRAEVGMANLPSMLPNGKKHYEKYPSLYVGRRVVPHIFGGFRLTTKLRSFVCQIAKIPPDDKAIILSFFKGSLDLIEALLFYEMRINYARIDGDIAGRTRQEALEKFKQDPVCRILLMTVQTGGTGLNINEANHVIFLDRWFNPCVHEQAEDRCHRIGQTKEVHVTYLDCSNTFDSAMKLVNETKRTNAAILLADGSKLSVAQSVLSFKEMTGVLGRAVETAQMRRKHELSKERVSSSTLPL